MKTGLKNYWWVLMVVILLLILPLLINLCYYFETDYYAMHAPSAWTSFWATYIGTIASFAMVLITWVTLKQNKEQLEEMKLQWKEQNTPKISCTLQKSSDYLLIEILNTSQAHAHKVSVHIINNTGRNIFRFDQTCAFLEKATFEIPPFSVKQIPIYVTPCVDGDYEGYLSVEVSYEERKDMFDLYLKEINLTTWKYDVKNICDKIDSLDTTIKNKKLM